MVIHVCSRCHDYFDVKYVVQLRDIAPDLPNKMFCSRWCLEHYIEQWEKDHGKSIKG